MSENDEISVIFCIIFILFFHLSQTWKMLTLNQMLTLDGKPTNRLSRYADQTILFVRPKFKTAVLVCVRAAIAMLDFFTEQIPVRYRPVSFKQ